MYLCRPAVPRDGRDTDTGEAADSACRPSADGGGDFAGVRHVFVGDVIFADSIGRTDFPDGDHAQLRAGIRSKLFQPARTRAILLSRSWSPYNGRAGEDEATRLWG